MRGETEANGVGFEFAAVTGYHRKHAMRLLRAGQVNRRGGPRPGRRIYDEAVREALIVIWEADLEQDASRAKRPAVSIQITRARIRCGGSRRRSIRMGAIADRACVPIASYLPETTNWGSKQASE
jgi:hypothetical protein